MYSWRSDYGFIGTGLPTGAHLVFLIAPSQSVSGALVARIKSKSFHVDKMHLEELYDTRLTWQNIGLTVRATAEKMLYSVGRRRAVKMGTSCFTKASVSAHGAFSSSLWVSSVSRIKRWK